MRSNNIRGANNSLEQAISNNFKIRENPLFMLVKGEIELKQGNLLEALVTLESAYNLPVKYTNKYAFHHCIKCI